MIDFRAALAALTGSDVQFIIVGGAAATAHGAARLTQDLDVVYVARGLNFTLTTAIGDIDLLGEIVGGGTYQDLRRSSYRCSAPAAGAWVCRSSST